MVHGGGTSREPAVGFLSVVVPRPVVIDALPEGGVAAGQSKEVDPPGWLLKGQSARVLVK